MRARVRPRGLFIACALVLAVAACAVGATKVLANVGGQHASSLKLAAAPTTATVHDGAASTQHRKKVRYLKHHTTSPVNPKPTASPTATPTVKTSPTASTPVTTPSTTAPVPPVSPTATSAPVTTPPQGSNPGCSAAANTPGGADPWGGCWPGPGNTGSTSSGLSPYAGKVQTDGSCIITADTVITGKTMDCEIVINSGNVTLDNVSLTGQVYNNGNGSLVIEDSTLNGSDAETETVLSSNLTIKNSNLYGSQHEVYCGGDCTIENSWLHDNHNFGDADHQNGFLSTGGSVYDLEHNSIGCVGGCTADIAFLGDESKATVNQNLLVASPDAAYCIYPTSGGHSDIIVNQMTITNNVFQRGANGKCAYYGPVYGWDDPNNSPGTSGYLNVWSGNTWDNGKVLNSP
jgi:hypothetical protein